MTNGIFKLRNNSPAGCNEEELIANINETRNRLYKIGKYDELKKRKTNTDIIKTFPNELRQLCFAMNINAKSYHDLNYKLSENINL